MSAIQDFIGEVNAAINYDIDEVQATTWIRMAETNIGQMLRCQEQVTIAENLVVVSSRVELPRGWQELDFVRNINWGELRYTSRSKLYNGYSRGNYSLAGNFILFNDPVNLIDGTPIEVTYFDSIPELGAADTWFSTQYRWLLMASVTAYASFHLEENEKAIALNGSVSSGVQMINDAYAKKKASGSTLVVDNKRPLFTDEADRPYVTKPRRGF